MEEKTKERLLADYVYALVSGQSPKKEEYMNRCPVEDREQLSQAINTARLTHAVINSVRLPGPEAAERMRQKVRAAISDGRWR